MQNFAVGLNLMTQTRGFLVAPEDKFLTVGDIVETAKGRYRVLFSAFRDEESDVATALTLVFGLPEKIEKRVLEEVFNWNVE